MNLGSKIERIASVEELNCSIRLEIGKILVLRAAPFVVMSSKRDAGNEVFQDSTKHFLGSPISNLSTDFREKSKECEIRISTVLEVPYLELNGGDKPVSR